MTVINIQVQDQDATSHRISTPRDAVVGTICAFKCKGKLEYGRIVNVTATSVRIERMQKTASSEFILHPNQKNTTTKNVITFSRKIEAVVSQPRLSLYLNLHLHLNNPCCMEESSEGIRMHNPKCDDLMILCAHN